MIGWFILANALDWSRPPRTMVGTENAGFFYVPFAILAVFWAVMRIVITWVRYARPGAPKPS